MQKLNLTVLLQFLSQYSHWNLVKQPHCYHLYFIAKENGADKNQKRKKLKELRKLNSKTRVKCSKLRNKAVRSQRSKDLFFFNPVHKSSENKANALIDNSVSATDNEIFSRRSSFSSFIWDDYLPSYKQESDEFDLDKQDNSSDDDSGRSTPIAAEVGDSAKMERFYEESVLKQGDRLLKEMLQLRQDLEKDKLDFEVTGGIKEPKSNNASLIPSYGPLDLNEENSLREKLEMMTLQIKKEMEEEFKKKQNEMKFAENEDDDSKIKKIFKNILSDETSEDSQSNPTVHKAALQAAIKNLLLMDETPKTFEEAQKMFQTNSNTNLEKSKKKKAKNNERNAGKKQTVEIPFCSHKLKSSNKEDSRSSTPLMTTSNVPAKEASTEPKLTSTTSSSTSTTSSSNPIPKLVLNPEEKRAAEDILRNLIEIRDKDKQQPDPVLDTMISVIQLSSANVNLPSPVTSGAAAGIHFRELFDFEVNFSESKEAFAKLAGLSGDKNVTVQELFPWTLHHSKNKQYEALKKDNFL